MDIESIVKRVSHSRFSRIEANDRSDYYTVEGCNPDCVRCTLESYATSQRELRAAGIALLRKLDQVEKDTQGIFVMAHFHGNDYKGANWSKEYKALSAILEGKV